MLRFGQYEVTGELGRGGMGIVYRGFDPIIRREVALKTIRFQDLTDEEERQQMQERLEREAQSAGRLSHPNIVTIYQFGYQQLEEGETVAFLAMECVRGRTLSALMPMARSAAPTVVIGLLRQTAVALDYAHAQGVIHRDVKPANLLVTPEGQVKITDFGVARIASQTMTRAGAVIGSPFYMSAEQVRGEKADARADQYSLAVVAYEIFGGRRPFEAETISALVYKIVNEEPPLLQLEPSVRADKLNPVLRRALDKDPNQRFESCAAFVDAMEEALLVSPAPLAAAEEAAAPKPGQPDVTPVPLQSSRRRVLVIAAGSVVVLGAAGIFAWRMATPGAPPKQAPEIAASKAAPPPQPASVTPPASQPEAPVAGGAPAAGTRTARPATSGTSGKSTKDAPAGKVSVTVRGASGKSERTASGQVRTQPKIVKQVPIPYTEQARLARVEGVSTFALDINTQGFPRVRPVHGLEPSLDKKAAESLLQWRFEPGTLNKRPVVSNITVELKYQLTGTGRRLLFFKK
jgi:tRNA A-37 threonylcarbamoyl transferase component Bud32